ncbi:MAG: hypothetical protein COB33_015580 [Thiotrichaceae bacterium]|nr:hypothetical protein [Thiotrichaceae bacterium]
MPPLNLPLRLAMFPLILLVLMVLVLQGCSSDNAPVVPVEPIPDANPVGYYIDDGTATVSDGGSSTISIGDFQAIVYGNRIMMMSVEKELLYDGTITSIDGNDYTAEFTIYKDGINVTTATVTGQITTGASVTGTLSGSGFGDGEFSLLYGTNNDEVASLDRIENTTNDTWGAMIGGNATIDEYEFEIDAVGSVVDDANTTLGVFHACQIIGASTPIVDANFYEFTFDLRTCADGDVTADNYSGLATIRSDAGPDNTLVLMMNNGTYSFSGDFK